MIKLFIFVYVYRVCLCVWEERGSEQYMNIMHKLCCICVQHTHTQTHIWKHGNIWHVGNNVCQLEGYKIGLERKIIKNEKIFSKSPILKKKLKKMGKQSP